MTTVTRRNVLMTAFTAAVVTGTGAALAPVVLADQDDGAAAPNGGPDLATDSFEETYRGRRIQGRTLSTCGARPAAYRKGAAAAPDVPGIEISIDGRPLHVMRRADGTYLSLVNHYESFPTPLAVARAAVDRIGTAQLSLTTTHHH
ncbi:tyrosinase family oxidase copper chaperone [Streptomyces olivoreticuli]|uniref:tyrosinase family oxidase copper chaperone n=1 Tax=Streptomyces olivoreticuli TaxID=68246 RepID=UPI000E2816AF|nr:tyrosinase family oxidase copper chaperone [Streptomyces olivoreticuli]